MKFRLRAKVNTQFIRRGRLLFAVALMGVIGVSVLSYWNTSRLIADEEEVTHIYNVISALNRILAASHRAEERILNNDDPRNSTIDMLRAVETELNIQLQELDELTTNSQFPQERVAALRQLVKDYFAKLNAAATSQRSGNSASFDQILDEQQQQFSSAAEKIIDEMSETANRFLITRQDASNTTQQKTFVTLLLISAGTVLLLCVVFYSFDREISKRRQIGTALSESEQRLRTQYNSLPIPTYTWRKINGNFILADYNDAAREATQGRIAEFIGIDIRGMYADMPSLIAVIEQCYAERKIMRLDTLYRFRTTGATRYIDMTCVFVAPDSVMVHAEDIHERKQAQEVAIHEHNLLRTVIDILPDYIFAKDRDGHFILTNIAHAQAANVTPTEMVGKTAYELFPYEMAEQFSHDDEAMLESEEALINVERETRDAEGNKRIVLTSKVPLRDGQNNIIGLVGISRNITELKKTQEALRESEERSRSIVASLTEAIILRYADGSLGFMNPSAEQITETLVKDEEGRPYFYDDNGNVLSKEERPTSIALRTGRPQQDMVLGVMRQDGKQLWVSVNAQPLFHSGEDVPYATLSSFSDITERMRLEQALSEALERALEASRAKSTFLATMSHEIRTPMNGVIGMTDLVLETSLTDQQREMVEIIRVSANTLLSIINDILDFSKIEAGKLNLENIEFQPVTLLEAAADILAPKAQEKKLSLMTFIDPAIPRVLCGDILRLHQILINLMGNAIKFTEEGEVIIRATLENITSNNATIRFSVNDTGIGLSEAVRQRLFQPFVQADDSTTRKYGGTGLGLAICARLVELMNGSIGVESNEGAGACFWFSVPLQISAITEDVQPLSLEGLRVLVVESSAVSAEILVSYLSKGAATVESVLDGGDALGKLRSGIDAKRPYDAVILNPTSSFELAKTLKGDSLLSSTNLIALWDYAKNGQTDTDQGELFSVSLSKPIKQMQLLQALSNLPGQPTNRSTTVAAIAAQEIAEREAQILLVEDNAINQKVAVMQLKKLGLSVQTASNGQQALDALVEDSYSLILMDCQMPGIDGFEATRRIRKLEIDSRNHIPIIAMTANAMQGDREQCLAAGMDDYISKPISLAQLQEVLEKWLRT